MTKPQPRIRSFVAVEFPKSFRDHFVACQQSLSSETIDSLRFTKRHQFHLTLMFLGDCTTVELEKIDATLRAIRHPPLSMECIGYDFFNSSTIYARISGADSLARMVNEKLAPLHIAQGHLNFIGHATLARMKKKKSSASIRRLLKNLPSLSEISTAEKFCLYQSKISHLGADYSVIETYSLG